MPEEKPIDGGGSADTGIETLPEPWQKEVKKLREESAASRVKAKELTDKVKADADELTRLKKAEEARIAEQGDFRKLYEEAKPKLDALETVSQEAAAYRKHFQRQLDAVLDGADETLKDLITSSGKPIQEKLEMAIKLKGAAAASTSQVSVRPGGALKTDGDMVKKFQEARTPGERARLLTEAKRNHPKIYETIRKLA